MSTPGQPQPASPFVLSIAGIDYSYYLLCAMGAFVLFFKMQKEGCNCIDILGHINPKWKDHPLCRLSEAVLFSILGAFIGTILSQPINPQQAIIAGLGWTGLVSSFSRSDKRGSHG